MFDQLWVGQEASLQRWLPVVDEAAPAVPELPATPLLPPEQRGPGELPQLGGITPRHEGRPLPRHTALPARAVNDPSRRLHSARRIDQGLLKDPARAFSLMEAPTRLYAKWAPIPRRIAN